VVSPGNRADVVHANAREVLAGVPRGAKVCPKVILEGTRLTHKTDIAFGLERPS
jgi:hypothetical protein